MLVDKDGDPRSMLVDKDGDPRSMLADKDGNLVPIFPIWWKKLHTTSMIDNGIAYEQKSLQQN